MNNTNSLVEILEIEMKHLDFSNKYCIFLKESQTDTITLTLIDYHYKEQFVKEFDLIWCESQNAYLITDLDLRLSQLVAKELVFQDIEFFTKMIPVTEYNKLVFKYEKRNRTEVESSTIQ